MLVETVFPSIAMALTSGPSQPEVQGFEPVGTTEMVDLFSGDFTYNIPLFDVGGYPVNLSYHSGPTMDEEASWVGLGWTLNPGSIVRNMRGIPDDFNREKITNTTNVKKNETWALNVETDLELFGAQKAKPSGDKEKLFPLRLGIGISHNSYKGFGLSLDLSVTPGVFIDKLGTVDQSNALNFGLSANSQTGLSADLSFSGGLKVLEKQADAIGSVTAGFNSRAGMKELAFNTSLRRHEKTFKKTNVTKRFNSSASLDLAGVSLDFSTPTYIPYRQSSFKTFSFTLSGKLGGELFGFMPNAKATGCYSRQELFNKVESEDSYGYYYLGNVPNDETGHKAILDFNREKDGPFMKTTPNLPVTNLTYDVYSVTGQGVGGMVRLHRSDHGHVYDSDRKTVSNSGRVGLDFGAGNLFKGGINLQYVNASSTSGLWKDDNVAKSLIPFRTRNSIPAAQKPLFEAAYFKTAGEPTKLNSTFKNSIKSEEPLRVNIHRSGLTGATRTTFSNHNNQTSSMSANYLSERNPRNQVVSVLTAQEASNYGLDKKLKVQWSNQVSYYNRYDPPNSIAKAHHFSEFTITKSDGWRYVYGIPVYNSVHKEVTFSVAGTQDAQQCAKGLITYTSTEASKSNTSGTDNFYSKREIPPYAHSYLLTAVLSPDYADLTGDGISLDDVGTAVEFRYTRFYTAPNNPYKWRTPIAASSMQGNYDEGFKSKKGDDKASYVYGEKELWYLRTIESRTHVAMFYSSMRDDGRGLTGEHGVPGTDNPDKVRRLDSVKLFSRVDLEPNGPNAVPIKAVYFVYDYGLCGGAPNGTGKLKLKELYFTYGTSKKGRLNSYKFHYGDYNHDGLISGTEGNRYNPTYHPKAHDRWGNYKPNSGTCDYISDPLSNAEFPYTDQRVILSGDADWYESTDSTRTYADAYAIAWNLTTIDLPTGGTINIDYESDDYAFVQDKQSMRMFEIVGLNDEPEYSTQGNLYDKDNPKKYYDYVIFKLNEPVDVTQANTQAILADYFRGINDLYFRALVYIQDFKSGSETTKYEWVSGYCNIASNGYGFVNTGGNVREYGWVRLKTVGLKDNGGGDLVNPIAKAALNFTRLYLPERVYSGSDPKSTGESALRGLLAALAEVKNMFGNDYMVMMKKKDPFCQKILVNKSFIRLNEPTHFKKGGGARVKKVTVSDNWKEMLNSATHGENFEYGQEYDYTTREIVNGRWKTISSGVASYEPILGGDENPWRQPRAFERKLALIPNEQYYLETPFGESFFPSPSVGYSKVTVRSLQHDNVKRTATGHTVHEFYTSRDFPTRPLETKVEVLPILQNPLISFLKVGLKQSMAVSQGYSIELNDMHGKPKAQWSYAEGQDGLVSGVEYYYKTDISNSKRLSNTVSVLRPDGTTGTETIGEDIDIVTDFRRNYDETIMGNIQINADGFLLAIFPLVIPMVWPTGGFTRREFKSVVTTKVIHRYGILDRTVAHDFGSTITTYNKQWDSETGQVLLTETHNEYGDKIFNMTYPAHWAYSGMSGAYHNIGAALDLGPIDDSYVSTAPLIPSDYFHVGDELSLKTGKYWGPYTVLEVDDVQKRIYFVNRNGQPTDKGTGTFKVLRSGRRNMQSTPVGALTALQNPVGGGSVDWNTLDSVINASATLFSDRWQMPCQEGPPIECDQDCDLIETQPPMTVAIEQILGLMATDGCFASDTVLMVLDTPAFFYDHYDVMAPYNPDTAIPHYWYSIYSDSATYVGSFGSVLGSGCILSLTSPELDPVPWESLIGFSNITPLWPYDPCDSGFTYDFEITAEFSGGVGPITLFGSTSCFPLMHCTSSYPPGCLNTLGSKINPYVRGIRGNWRPKQTFAFHESRLPGDSSDIRYAGTIGNFDPFWKWDVVEGWYGDVANPKWVSPATVTKVIPWGYEVENVDALGNYSAAQYGYANTLPVAVASNARYNQIAFDGFEDYAFHTDGCLKDHFSYRDALVSSNVNLSTEYAHTGLRSIKPKSCIRESYRRFDEVQIIEEMLEEMSSFSLS